MSDSRAWSFSIEDREKVIQGAIEAKKGAYCPYSNFPVGAALLCADGSVIKGANVENASSGGTICAERTAVVKAVSEGTKSFIALAVTSNVPAPIGPCGICRQVLREFCALEMPVFLVSADYPNKSKDGKDPVLESTIGALLPHSFGPEDLERPRRDV